MEPGARSRFPAAVSFIFLLVGIMIGSWYARIPQLRLDLGLTDPQLGTALLAQTAGLIVAMQLAGHLVARHGSRAVIRVTAVLVPWFLPVIVSMPGVASAVAMMFAWGLVAGVLDVAMNAQAIEVERAARRPVLNRLQATWSVGALLGALLATAAVHNGLSLVTHFTIMGFVLTGIAVACGRRLIPDSAVAEAAAARPRRLGLRAGWTGRVIVLGGVGAAAAFCEGAASSWCGVFVQEQRGASPNVASLCYATFIVAVTGTRMVGDRLHDRLGAVTLVRSSVIVGALGLGLALATPKVVLVVVGFGVLGCGVAVLFPIICGAVGHGGPADGSAGLAIARFSTLHYGGVLLGPSAVGWLAGAFGISTALLLLLVPLAAIGLFAAATAPASLVRGGARTDPRDAVGAG